MPSRNGSQSAFESVDALVEAAREAQEELQGQRDALMLQVGEVDAQIRRLNRITRAAESTSKGPKKKSKNGNRVGRENVEKLIGAMRKNPEKVFTVGDVSQTLGVGKSSAHMALKTLREEQVIRQTGLVPRTGTRGGRGSMGYRLMP